MLQAIIRAKVHCAHMVDPDGVGSEDGLVDVGDETHVAVADKH